MSASIRGLEKAVQNDQRELTISIPDLVGGTLDMRTSIHLGRSDDRFDQNGRVEKRQLYISIISVLSDYP